LAESRDEDGKLGPTYVHDERHYDNTVPPFSMSKIAVLNKRDNTGVLTKSLWLDLEYDKKMVVEA
jgi:hypothetical protein